MILDKQYARYDKIDFWLAEFNTYEKDIQKIKSYKPDDLINNSKKIKEVLNSLKELRAKAQKYYEIEGRNRDSVSGTPQAMIHVSHVDTWLFILSIIDSEIIEIEKIEKNLEQILKQNTLRTSTKTER